MGIWHWYKPELWDWPTQNEWLSVGFRFYGFGIGFVSTYWGYRILLGRWQLVFHRKEEK